MKFCMRLQKQLSRVVDGKKYYKYVLVVPNKMVKKLKWKEGLRMEFDIK